VCKLLERQSHNQAVSNFPPSRPSSMTYTVGDDFLLQLAVCFSYTTLPCPMMNDLLLDSIISKEPLHDNKISIPSATSVSVPRIGGWFGGPPPPRPTSVPPNSRGSLTSLASFKMDVYRPPIRPGFASSPWLLTTDDSLFSTVSSSITCHIFFLFYSIISWVTWNCKKRIQR
jgi:hypothetical protein